MKRLLLIIIVLIIMSFVVYSEETYPQFGGEYSDYFSDDTSLFNENIENDEVSDIQAINDPQFIPLVADLENDGTNEIVVLGDGTIGIYQAIQSGTGVSISALGGYDTTATTDGDYWSNMLIYDIDLDGIKEIIVYSAEDDYIYIVNWNGTHATDEGFSLGYGYWDVTFNERSNDAMIGCGDSDGCVIIHNDRNRFTGSGTRYIYATPFNSSELISSKQLILQSQGWSPDSIAFCMPKHKTVQYDSIDDYYYFTYGKNPANIYISQLQLNSTKDLTFSKTLNSHTVYPIPIDCGRGITYFTSPTLIEFSSVNTGKEVGYAWQHDVDEYKIVVYKQSLDEYDEYPELQQADGIIKSNPLVSNAFIDSDETSLCVVGYQKDYADNGRMDILCADAESDLSGSQKNTEFIYDFDSPVDFNVSAVDVYTVASHSINSKQNDRSQILTPYGIFDLEDVSGSVGILCSTSQICDAEILWTMPIQEEVATISVDITDSGFEDILALTETNLYYIDDGFVNQNAYLGYCTRIEPSIDAIWQIHEYGTSYINDELVGTATPSSFELTTGKDVLGSYFLTWVADGSSHSIKEDGRLVNITYNITGLCAGLSTGKMAIRSWWDSDDPSDLINVYGYNYNTSTWDLRTLIYDTAGYNWTNITGTTEDLLPYVQNDTLRIRFEDTTGADGADNYFYLDYLAIECYGQEVEVPSNKTNEVKVRVKPVDPEANVVSARVVLYNGELNEQDSGWSANYSSGTQIPFSGLIPNETTSGSTLRLYYRDSQNYYNEPTYTDYTFIVQSSGDTTDDSNSCEGFTESEYEEGIQECTEDSDCDGDYVCSSGYCTALPDTCDSIGDCPSGYACVGNECVLIPDNEDNAVTTAVGTFSYLSGVPILVLFLLILAFISYNVIVSNIPSKYKFPVIVIIAFFLIGAGVAMSMISILWLLLFIIVSLAVLGVFVAGRMRAGV